MRGRSGRLGFGRSAIVDRWGEKLALGPQCVVRRTGGSHDSECIC